MSNDGAIAQAASQFTRVRLAHTSLPLVRMPRLTGRLISVQPDDNFSRPGYEITMPVMFKAVLAAAEKS